MTVENVAITTKVATTMGGHAKWESANSRTVLMADGSVTPIAEVQFGGKVSDARGVQQHAVTAPHITSNNRDFATVTVPTAAGSPVDHHRRPSFGRADRRAAIPIATAGLTVVG
jgi:hypothetical protein